MRKLLQGLFQRPQNKGLARRKANRRPNLVLERLEDRTVPSSFTVTFSEMGVPGATVTITDNNPVNSLGGPGDTNPAVGTISVTNLTVGDFTVSGEASLSDSSLNILPAVVTSNVTAFNNDPGVSHQLNITTLDTGFNVPPAGTTVNMATTLADTSPLAQPTDTFFSTLGAVDGTTLTTTGAPASAGPVTDVETIPTTPYGLGNTLSLTVVGAAPIGGAGNTVGEVQAQGTTVLTAAANPEIAIVKLTNGTNNDSPPVAGVPDGPIVPVGSTVTWTYNVTDPGNEPIANVNVTDNVAGVNPQPVLSGGFNVGDTNDNGLLDPGETWVFTASGAAIAGQYSNIGTVTGTSTITITPVTANNPDHYFGYTTNISILKLTNGTNNDSPPVAGTPDGPIVPVGSTVTWTYDVTTTGNVPLSSVAVTDNIAGVNPTPVLSGGFNVGDTNHDGLLEAGETWVFTASGTAIAGQYSNIGTATGTPVTPSGGSIPGATTQTATNPDHYFGYTTNISILKLTNGTNNDSPPVAGTPDGPIVPVGSTVTWTYDVTTTGNVPLSSVAVTDNIAGVNPTPVLSGGFNVGDTNHDGLLEAGETWVFTASGTAIAGQYSNIGTATGTPSTPAGTPIPGAPTQTATNPDHYFGQTPTIQIVKLTNGTNNDSPPVAGTPDGPIVPVGSTVTWTYNVTDTGSNVPLSNITVTDNIAGVNPTPVLSGGFNVGDTNQDGLLEPGETWVFTASGTATAGQYSNIGTATGTPPTGPNVTATNPDHYFGYTTNISILKLTNGTNNDSPPVAGTPDGPIVPVGSTVTWTYDVTTTGNVPLSSVAVTDNIAGVNPTPVLSGGFNVGDTNHDGLLEAGETWVFTASGTAIAGQYSNIGTATGTPSTPAGTPIPGAPTQTATNPDHYFGQTTGTPDLAITKTADSASVTAGQPIGFVVTITNTGNANATSVSLNDPLQGFGDLSWTIASQSDSAGSNTFTITGAQGKQVLTLTNNGSVTLHAGEVLTVHITSPTSAADTTGSSTSTAPSWLGAAGDYAILYTGTGGHNLQITNITAHGNVGVGGTGHVQFGGPGTIGGRLDFAAANTGQYSNNNGSNVGPTSVNYSVAAVTTALNTVTTLSSSLAISATVLGTNIAINGTQTINESAGTLDTVNGVTYRVFNVTSYSENDGKLVTINGDGSGDPVVLDFGFNSNVNLGGDVALTGGLTDDQVLWNFTTSGQNVSLNNNASSYPNLAFHGDIIAINDAISVVNSNVSGRIFGGNSSDMQIVSGDTIKAPLLNTATVAATNVSFDSDDKATATVTITPPGSPLGKDAAATIGFWANKNGQAVINSFNGSSSSKLLGNWLATNFPNLFGGFAGQTNAQVAADFTTAKGNVGGVQGNTYAQTFAVALAVYATDPTLGGNTTVAGFNFIIKSGGTGSDTFNVGSNGAAFGVPNNTSLSVLQILQILNSDYSATTGFYSGSQTLTSAANNVTNGINQGGDITLIAGGSAVVSESADQALVTNLRPLDTGVFTIAVDALTDPQAAAEQTQIDAAIASLNQELGSRGVTLVEIQGDDSVPADVHLHVADTSVIGGVDQGVLGVTQQGLGEVTIISGWNYYYGADPAAVGADQYDFESVVMHELGHTLGLGHSTDTASVMYPYLDTGEARRSLTANDLSLIDSDGGVAPEPLLAARHAGAGLGLPVAGTSKQEMGTSGGSMSTMAIEVSATPAVAPVTILAVNPAPGLAAQLFAVGDVAASPISSGSIANPQGIAMAQSPTRLNLIGSPPDGAARRTADGGGGDAVSFGDGVPMSSDALPTAATPAFVGGVSLLPLAENSTWGASRTAAPGSAPLTDLVLPCDAFFSLHGNESAAAGWTFRLPDVSQATEDLAVSAAVLAVLFSGVLDKRDDRDVKRNRFAWQS